MADIYIDATNITNTPATDKAYRELGEAYAQVIGNVRDFNAGFEVGGISYNPGVVILTTNSEPDPDEAAIITFIEDHDGSEDNFLASAKRLRRAAEQTVGVGAFTSVLSSPFQPGPLSAGDWQFKASVELKMDTAATWGAGGPDKAVEAQITRDGVELALFGWPFITYSAFQFSAGDTHAEGDNPVFDILVRRLGGSGDVMARRMKLEVAPVGSAAVEDQ